MKLFSKRPNLLKLGLAAVVLTFAAVNYAQSNGEGIPALVTVKSASASTLCVKNTSTDCTWYLNGSTVPIYLTNYEEQNP